MLSWRCVFWKLGVFCDYVFSSLELCIFSLPLGIEHFSGHVQPCSGVPWYFKTFWGSMFVPFRIVQFFQSCSTMFWHFLIFQDISRKIGVPCLVMFSHVPNVSSQIESGLFALWKTKLCNSFVWELWIFQNISNHVRVFDNCAISCKLCNVCWCLVELCSHVRYVMTFLLSQSSN